MVTTYVRTKLLKDSLGIANEDFDKKLEEIADNANNELDLQLKPYADKLPLKEGTPQWSQIEAIGIHYARKLWFRHYRQFDLVKSEEEDYDKKIEALKQSFLADRNSRTKTLLVSHDPRGDRLLVPAQAIDTVIFDNFS